MLLFITSLGCHQLHVTPVFDAVVVPRGAAAPEVAGQELSIIIDAAKENVSSIELTCGNHQQKKVVKVDNSTTLFYGLPSATRCEVVFQPQGAKYVGLPTDESLFCTIISSTRARCEETAPDFIFSALATVGSESPGDSILSDVLNEVGSSKVDAAFVDMGEGLDAPKKGGEGKRGTVTIFSALADEACDLKKHIAKNYRGQLQACYGKSLGENSELDGRITISMYIDSGSVEDVEFSKDRIGSASLRSCIEDKSKAWTFPATCDDFVSVSFRFSAP